MVTVLAAPAQERPSFTFVVVTGVVALALVATMWTVTHAAVTIAHEGSHALTASAVGGRVLAVLVQPTGHGVTWSFVKKGVPEFATFLAGYLGPPLFGLAGAILLNVGRVVGMLWLSLFFLLCALVMSRTGYSFLAILATAAMVLLVLRYASPGLQVAFGYTWIWFLLIGGIRSVLELSNARQAITDTSSDAYQLRRLTLIPATLWVGFFGLFTFAALVAGALILTGAV